MRTRQFGKPFSIILRFSNSRPPRHITVPAKKGELKIGEEMLRNCSCGSGRCAATGARLNEVTGNYEARKVELCYWCRVTRVYGMIGEFE
ncbi:hypothetical protein MKW98_005087 [Papaver atlanticum]|uniref:Uncharacterized protein n=1 Tax=Papaver atlanticum TaxID=357466 RepID=A0AAD4XEI0_9MAGN|nr:hypothetical protein MKW98_005087 [Papaver atlanticum]